MQLSIQRSRRMGGLAGGTAFFCLDVRAEYDQEERDDINRYKLGPQIVYQSREAKKHMETAQVRAAEGGWKNLLGSAASAVRGRLATNISIASLGRGHHVECKDMQELLEAEDELREASKNLTRYLQVAKTFNGQRILISYVNGEEQVQLAPLAEPPRLVDSGLRPALPSPDGYDYIELPASPFGPWFPKLSGWLRDKQDAATEWLANYRFKPMHLTVIIPVLLALVDWAVLALGPVQASVSTIAIPSSSPPGVQVVDGVPLFAASTPYQTVRAKLIELGWQPVSNIRSGGCGNTVCPHFPEVAVCSVIGDASCLYVWQNGMKSLRIRAIGGDYDDQSFHDTLVCRRFEYSMRFGLLCRN